MCISFSLSRSNSAQSSTIGSIKRVHLIWSTRTPDLLESFSYLLEDKFRGVSESAVKVFLHLYITSSPLMKRVSGTTPSRVELMGAVDQGKSGEALNVLDDENSNINIDVFTSVTPDETANRTNFGRPKYSALFKSISEAASPRGSTPTTSPHVACLVCGPEAMVEEVSALSFEYNFYFQAEEFHF